MTLNDLLKNYNRQFIPMLKITVTKDKNPLNQMYADLALATYGSFIIKAWVIRDAGEIVIEI